MFWREHGVPHFHASYGEFEVAVEIETGRIHGEFPNQARRLVLEWCTLHKQELLRDWQLARESQPLERISPLE